MFVCVCECVIFTHNIYGVSSVQFLYLLQIAGAITLFWDGTTTTHDVDGGLLSVSLLNGALSGVATLELDAITYNKSVALIYDNGRTRCVWIARIVIEDSYDMCDCGQSRRSVWNTDRVE